MAPALTHLGNGGRTMLEDQQWRMVQALQDFQHSLSALTFFCDIPDQTSKVERRRFRCYHDNAIIAYCRPFTTSKGLPTLSLKSIGIRPSKEEKELHNFILAHRNKVVAHTDTDRMRILLTSFEITDGIRMPHIVDDEGFALFDHSASFEKWLFKLTRAIAGLVFDLMQRPEGPFEFRRDYLDPTKVSVE